MSDVVGVHGSSSRAASSGPARWLARPDLWIAVAVLALCAYAVARQLGADPLGVDRVEALALGDRLDGSHELLGLDDEGKRYRIDRYFGERFTVLYTWSLKCPCVEEIEHRMKSLYARYNERTNGVGWLAIDGEPDDPPKVIIKVMAKLGAFYPVLRDPRQEVTQRLGLDRAVQVAIIDHQGRLRWRGPVDDSYYDEEVKQQYLAEALEVLVNGEGTLPVPPAEPVYGCLFADPASCEAAAAETEAIKAKRRADKESKRPGDGDAKPAAQDTPRPGS
ncbi:MAG: redoxin family protein [Planctomycetota bacterium]|nr:redoxin family protein [Planctomycetota bacterium]MCB9825777.1 redoxin family protein [Planctomycetota bacterium]